MDRKGWEAFRDAAHAALPDQDLALPAALGSDLDDLDPAQVATLFAPSADPFVAPTSHRTELVEVENITAHMTEAERLLWRLSHTLPMLPLEGLWMAIPLNQWEPFARQVRALVDQAEQPYWRQRHHLEAEAWRRRAAATTMPDEQVQQLGTWWAEGLLPHPPLYYLPEPQARTLAEALGVAWTAVRRPDPPEDPGTDDA